MGAGGFLLSNYQSEIPEIFEVGKDLAVYESQEDLLQKIDYYLSHDEERIAIAKSGQEKVRACHSYKEKLQQILELSL
jgi:spore maturation protein CgeB